MTTGTIKPGQKVRKRGRVYRVISVGPKTTHGRTDMIATLRDVVDGHDWQTSTSGCVQVDDDGRPVPQQLTTREQSMIALLELALRELEHELEAAGPDEVRQHPMLRDKDRFVRRARRQVATWKGTRCYIEVGGRRKYFDTVDDASRIVNEIMDRTGVIVGIQVA